MTVSRQEAGAHHIDPATPTSVRQHDRNQPAQLHESLATLLAARGQWRQAYEHLRLALELSRHPNGSAGLPDELRGELDRLRREHAEVREQSLRDSLTASYNRRYLNQRLDDLLVAKPTGTGLAVALVDLDFFKQVNDEHGHLLGDQVLQKVVEILQDSLPDGAFCARYGGDEFVLVLPDVGAAEAVVVCEATRARVERQPWTELVAGLGVTVSIGVAHRAPLRPGLPACSTEPIGPGSVPELLRSADHLLYRAKQSGRNAVAWG